MCLCFDVISQNNSPLIHSDFTQVANGPIRVVDSGHRVRLTTNTGNNAKLSIIDGRVTNLANDVGSAAGHMMVEGDFGPIVQIGAEFEVDEGSTDGGALALVIWSEPLIYPGPVVDSEMHLTFSNSSWNIGTFENQVYTSFGTGTLKKPLQPNTSYTVSILIKEEVIYILLPDKHIVSLEIPELNYQSLLVPSWEVYQKNAASDWKAKIKKIWANNESYASKTNDSINQLTLHSALKASIHGVLASFKEYPPLELGNLSARVPLNSTAISESLDIKFIAPNTGSVVVEASASVDIQERGALFWTLLIHEAQFSEPRLVSKEIGTFTQNVRWLVNDLMPGQTYTAKWHHRQVNGKSLVKLNREAGEVVSFAVSPVKKSH